MSTDRSNAGVAGSGEDVINVVGTGPYNINAGDSVRVAFALIAGDDLADIQASAFEAQKLYDLLFPEDINASVFENYINPSKASIGNISPNPATGKTQISFFLPVSGNAKLDVYDNSGKLVKNIFTEHLQAGIHVATIDVSGLSPGVYHCRLDAGYERPVVKFLVAGN
jgi:serine protease